MQHSYNANVPIVHPMRVLDSIPYLTPIRTRTRTRTQVPIVHPMWVFDSISYQETRDTSFDAQSAYYRTA